MINVAMKKAERDRGWPKFMHSITESQMVSFKCYGKSISWMVCFSKHFPIRYAILLWSMGLTFLSMSCKLQETAQFQRELAASGWQLQLEDPCTGKWEDNWFKDGLVSKVEVSEQGMNLIAGPEHRNDAHHTVLWTKSSFSGDIKIQYQYTRTDTQVINVNILYIQATGIGIEGRGKDISQWNVYREVPTMSKYYYNMDPLHISYAAFPMVNSDPSNDYIRVRKYPAEVQKFGETEVPPAYFETGLFLPFETYQVTVIKTDTKLFFSVKGKDIEKLYTWNLQEKQSPTEGRIGLRHMFTRSARYSDFRVYTR